MTFDSHIFYSEDRRDGDISPGVETLMVSVAGFSVLPGIVPIAGGSAFLHRIGLLKYPSPRFKRVAGVFCDLRESKA